MSEQTEVSESEALAQMLAAMRAHGSDNSEPVSAAAALGECIGKSMRIAALVGCIQGETEIDMGDAPRVSLELCKLLAVSLPPEWIGALKSELRALKSEDEAND